MISAIDASAIPIRTVLRSGLIEISCSTADDVDTATVIT